MLDHLVGDRKGNVHRRDAAGDAGLDVGEDGPVPGDQPGIKPQVDQAADSGPLFFPHGRDAALQFLTPMASSMRAMAIFSFRTEDHAGGLLAVPQGGVVDDDCTGQSCSICRPPQRKAPKPIRVCGATLPHTIPT